MAEVFLAQQRGLEGFDRRVAVKRILPHLADSPDFVKMFFGEARLAAQLSHPNVVHIYEFGKVDHDYFIAMEYVDGVHAGQLFKHGTEKDKLPATLVARIGADAANALHYAHELRDATGKRVGLVHRDVSPANIMVSFDGVVKLCDFGIAKAAAASDHLTNPGQVKGKYAYMSPEQTIAAQLDGRSDVFSLAIVMWELLTGKTIVPRGDAIAAMRAIRDGKLDPVEKVNPQVPAPLAAAISWALEPKREKRADAAELAQALEAFVKSAPDLATSMQLGGWIRARFPREGTGQMPALDPPIGAGGPGTHASPGTYASPGTFVAPRTMVSPGTVAAPGTASPVALRPATPPVFPVRRVVKLLADTADGTEIYTTTSDLDEAAETIKSGPAHARDFDDAVRDLDDESAQTIKGARPPKLAPRAGALPPPRTPGLASPRTPGLASGTHVPTSLPDEPTLHQAPPRADATELHQGPPVPADEEDSDLGGATIQRESRAVAPIAIPTRVHPVVDARASADPRAALDAAPAISDGAARAMSSAAAARAVSESAARPVADAIDEATRSAGDLSRPAGDLSRTAGDLSRTAGDPARAASDMSRAAGDAPRTAGDPSRAASDMSRAAGDAPRTATDVVRAVSDFEPRAVLSAPDLARAGSRGALVEGRRSLDPIELARKRRTKLLLAVVGLAGLALLSFAIALAASRAKQHAAPPDAAQVVVAPIDEPPADAAVPTAPPPVDAAPEPTLPAVTADAGTTRDGMAYLVVRTIPDGGRIKVGDQSRRAVVQPGDPTRAATAQLVLPPGKHVVTAELDGYRPEKRAVVLERGDHQRIEIAFTKKIVTRPDRGPPTGLLTVRTTPWSDVYLGGKKLGQAPFADLALPVGTYTLTFKNPSRPTVTKTVTIKPGKPAKLNFNLP
jgi:hypothetical protein